MTARALTPTAFAEAYCIPVRQVQKMIRQKRIRARNVGTDHCPRYRIPASECARFD
jgi:hypothetical protein